MTSISGIMCVWEEAVMAPLAIKSVHRFIDELVVVNKPGRDDTEAVIRDTCRDYGLKLKFYNYDMRLRFARMKAFKEASGEWCLIVDGDEVYHTDGEYGAHILTNLIDSHSDGATWRAPMNYLYLDFNHTRNDVKQMAYHRFFYKNDGKLSLQGTKDLPFRGGRRVNINHVFKFNCGIKDAARIQLRRMGWTRWSKSYKGELDFYEWVKLRGIDVEELASENLYNRDEVVLYDADKWGVRPKVIRDLMEKGVYLPE